MKEAVRNIWEMPAAELEWEILKALVVIVLGMGAVYLFLKWRVRKG